MLPMQTVPVQMYPRSLCAPADRHYGAQHVAAELIMFSAIL